MEIIRHKQGEKFSQAVIHGDTIYLCGQSAADATADIRQQTQETLDKIDALLAELGSDKNKILSATIWLVDVRDFDAMNEVWIAWVDQRPARVTVGTPLMRKGLLVEISIIAAR
jgi:enamine deaminase RidA (YjgF/YER057c/UK114 family)